MDIFNLDSDSLDNRCCQLADIVWNNAFLSGLNKFNKSELIYLCFKLTTRLNQLSIPIYCELDAKDVAFFDKCTIIETLNENFFK